MSVDTKTVIKKIYPTISELNSIQNNITCTEEGCDMVFKSHSNFTMHLQKHHKKQNLETTDTDFIRQFYCPEFSCQYHDKLYFNKIKYLKQHYLKIHADKNFKCVKCSKGFSTENALVRHNEICGVLFTCSECTYSYTSYESLLTHSRRKKHIIMNKSDFSSQSTKPKNEQSSTLYKQTIHIIPVPLVVMQSIERLDKECQTELRSKVKSPPKRKSTQQQQTQTCNKKKSRISAETQTTGDCILKKAIQEAKIKVEENNDKNSQTSVKFSDIKSEVDLNFLNNENIMHSSCQTNLNNLNIFEDSTFGNCNSQTQTDLIFQDEFLQSSHIETQTSEDQLDLCSNMYTQTCEDQLLSELEFTNIQTQTNWPDYDMFVSTETQTLLTHNTKSVLDMALNGREISHMETQTDMEFKQLLEEINA